MFRRSLAVLPSVLLVFLSAPALWSQEPERVPEKVGGTAPRASAAKYKSHLEKDGFSIGAELLAKKQAAHAFAAEVNHCCLVVEVAVYPKKDQAVDLSLLDFTLEKEGSDSPVRAESATVVAAKLERQKYPGVTGVDVYPHGSVGYESGTYTDPVTGQPVHVHTVSTSVGVAAGSAGKVPPNVAADDRDVMEHELYEKALPEAKVSAPVSGYVYFAFPKPSDGKYRLTYSGQPEPLVLRVTSR